MLRHLWPVAAGLLLPAALILAAALLVPAHWPRFLGISAASWCLFACAPITSALLALCYRLGGDHEP